MPILDLVVCINGLYGGLHFITTELGISAFYTHRQFFVTDWHGLLLPFQF